MRFRRFVVVLSVLTTTVLLYLLHQILKRRKGDTFNKSIFTPRESPPLYVAVVVCGQRMQEVLVMIKSALLFNSSREKLYFLIFAEERLMISFNEKLNDWRAIRPEFDFRLLPLQFPVNSEREWRNLFKPCAAQRLFLPSILETVDAALYVDTDILFLSPVADIWKFFKSFNGTQIAALSPEHEDANVGWYNRFARHPYYGPLGVNSGVMLMNLTRMREFKWEEKVLPIYKEYKLRLTWGDQDIINILFYYHSEKLYLMPCEYNYRPDHCMYMNICNVSVEGIKVIHGNRGYFHSNKQPLFRTIYEAVESYQLGQNEYNEFLVPLREALQDPVIVKTNCGKIWKDVLLIANKVFQKEFVGPA